MAMYGMTVACKADFMNGVHCPEDEYRVALYSSDARLDPFMSTYSTEGEVKGKGYQAGGKILTGRKVLVRGTRVELSWERVVRWPVATIRARYALIYNRTKGNRAMTILDLGEDTASTNGPWELELPDVVIWIG